MFGVLLVQKNLKRGIGDRGPSGLMIWAGMIGLAVWGFYEV